MVLVEVLVEGRTASSGGGVVWRSVVEELDGGINVYGSSAPVERNTRHQGITPVQTHMVAVSTNVYLHYHHHHTALPPLPFSSFPSLLFAHNQLLYCSYYVDSILSHCEWITNTLTLWIEFSSI